MNNKFYIYIILLFISNSLFAQENNNVEKIIDSYIVYIQDINMNEVFNPELETKSLPINGKNIDVDVTYYNLSEKQLFSLIIQAYGQPEVKSTFYIKDNKLIAVFIEENNFTYKNNEKKYRNYFLKDDKIILEEPLNSSLDYEFFIDLGKALIDNRLKNNNK